MLPNSLGAWQARVNSVEGIVASGRGQAIVAIPRLEAPAKEEGWNQPRFPSRENRAGRSLPPAHAAAATCGAARLAFRRLCGTHQREADRLRVDGDSQGKGEATGSPKNPGPAIP